MRRLSFSKLFILNILKVFSEFVGYTHMTVIVKVKSVCKIILKINLRSLSYSILFIILPLINLSSGQSASLPQFYVLPFRDVKAPAVSTRLCLYTQRFFPFMRYNHRQSFPALHDTNHRMLREQTLVPTGVFHIPYPKIHRILINIPLCLNLCHLRRD